MAKVLVIDDDFNVTELLRSILERENLEVIAAKDGKEGIEAYKTNGADLVITDIIMPEKEGLETIMELRKINPEVIIIAMSGGGRAGPWNYLETAKKFGANKVFTKPFDRKEMVSSIKELLSI
ncbi:MAG: response regulator receiver protein [uncultured bacterium]|nr:MAG: response regulator receiver protein [uncultured bacterium]